MKPRRDYRAQGKLGGRPALGEMVSVGVYHTHRGRDILLIRFGARAAKELGLNKRTGVDIRISDDRRRLTVWAVPLKDGVPLRATSSGSTLSAQQTVTGVLPVMESRRIKPITVAGKMTLVIAEQSVPAGEP